jgi:hypothetical protein
MRRAQLPACFAAPPAAAEPLAEQQAGVRQVQAGRDLAEQLERITVPGLGVLVRAHQGLAAGQQAQSPGGARGLCPLRHPRQRRRRGIAAPGARARLDDQRQDEVTDRGRVLAEHRERVVEGGLVAAKAQVEQGKRVQSHHGHVPLATRLREAGDARYRGVQLVFPAGPGQQVGPVDRAVGREAGRGEEVVGLRVARVGFRETAGGDLRLRGDEERQAERVQRALTPVGRGDAIGELTAGADVPQLVGREGHENAERYAGFLQAVAGTQP